MRKLSNWMFTVTVIMGILAFGFVVPAGATVTLKINDGTNFFTVVDGGSGDVCASAGCVTFSGAVGNFIVNVSTGLTSLLGGPLTAPTLMDLNSVNVSSSSGGTIHISISDIGFSGTGPNPLVSSIGGTIAGGSITQADQCAGDALFATNYGCISLAPPTITASPFAVSKSGTVTPTLTGWALSEIVTATFTGAGSMSWDFSSSAVPEPSSLLLLGSGLVGLATWGIRRRR